MPKPPRPSVPRWNGWPGPTSAIRTSGATWEIDERRALERLNAHTTRKLQREIDALE